MDFIVQLPITKDGHDAIMVMVDKFSKFVCLIPTVSTVDAATCARLFFDFWICKYGLPDKLITDRDSKFTSLFW